MVSLNACVGNCAGIFNSSFENRGRGVVGENTNHMF